MLNNNMRFGFTEARIAKLPFAEKGQRYTVYDTNKRNFILRVGANTKAYYLLKKVNGRNIFTKLCDASNTKLENAYKLFDKQIGIINDGKNPNIEKKKVSRTITIGDFFTNFYFPNHSAVYKRPSSQREDQVYFRAHLAPIHGYRMADIDRAFVQRLQREIRDRAGLYASNHSIKLLRQMYNKAIDWGLEIINPATRIHLYREIRRDRFLQEDEMPRFFAALRQDPNANFACFIYLSLFLGQRRGNMQAIKWSDINFDRRVLYIPDTKTGKPQVVPIPEQAMVVLQEMQKHRTDDSPWLFPNKHTQSGHVENPKTKWHALLKRAEIENLRMHDLRRTFASYQAITGSSNEIIGKALGDSSPAVISTYARLGEHPVRQSIQNAANEIVRLAAAPSPERAENVETI